MSTHALCIYIYLHLHACTWSARARHLTRVINKCMIFCIHVHAHPCIYTVHVKHWVSTRDTSSNNTSSMYRPHTPKRNWRTEWGCTQQQNKRGDSWRSTRRISRSSDTLSRTTSDSIYLGLTYTHMRWFVLVALAVMQSGITIRRWKILWCLTKNNYCSS